MLNIENVDSVTERRIVTRLVNAFLAAGYGLGVHDGEEVTLRDSIDKTAIAAALASTDHDYLLIHRRGEPAHFAWVMLVWGNGWCVISDYSTNVEEVMAPVNSYADTFDK